VWTDMLQDHFRAGVLEKYRERVVFMPWDYTTGTPRSVRGRIGGGHRISRYWRNHPEDRSGPAISPKTAYVEDLPAKARKTVAPYFDGREFTSMFEADLFTA